MGSYLLLKGIKPDLILSSCALRAQETADGLSDIIEFTGTKHYLQELYLRPVETLKEVITLQDDSCESLFLIGHNPQLTDLVNHLVKDEHVSKLPTLGIIAINFDIEQWSDLEERSGSIDFFIYPKQFHYYMPQQIRAILKR